MKTIRLFLTVIFLTAIVSSYAQMAVNTDGSNAEPTAMLDVKSTTMGFLAPRMLASERGDITSPATGLLVYQTDAPAGYYYYSGSSWTQLGVASAATKWTTSGNNIYYNTGKVGIGTSSARQKFMVNSGIDLNFCVDGNEGYSSIYGLTDAGASNGFRVAGYPLMFTGDGAAGAEAMRIIANGNVGLGTTSPDYKLDITANNGRIRLLGTTGYCLLDLNNNAGSFNIGRESISGGSLVAGSSAYAGVLGVQADYPLQLATNNGVRMTILGSGNVGVGTTTPGHKLTVGGYMGFVGSTDNRIYFGENDYFRFDDASGNGLKFIYDDVERMRISNDGRLTVKGTYAQPQMLVGNDGSNGIFFEADGSSSHYNFKISQQNQLDAGLTFAASTTVGSTTFDTPLLALKQNGTVGINTTSMSYTLHVNGSAGGPSAYQVTSDKRFKKDVLPISGALQKVVALQGVTFNWDKAVNSEINFDDKNHFGFLAQDIEKVLPQVVNTADDEMQTKSVAYSDVVPVLVEAIKEQQLIIEKQQKQIDELNSQNLVLVQKAGAIDQLKAKIENLTKIVNANNTQFSHNQEK